MTASGLAQWGPPATKDFLGITPGRDVAARAGVHGPLAARRRQRVRPDPPARPAESGDLMSTTILRTADAWWVSTPAGAARIDTDATTTGGLLAERERIEAARRRAARPVDPATLDLVSPVTAPCRVVAQMTNFASHVKDSGLDPDTIPLTFFRKTSGSISGPFDDIVRPGHVRFLDYEVEIGLVIGRELPVGTQVTEDNWTAFVAGPGGDQRRLGPRRAAAEDPVLRGQVLPDLHAGRAGAGPARRRRAQAVRRPAPAAVGQRRAAPGRGGRRRHDLLAAAGAAGADPVPAAGRR